MSNKRKKYAVCEGGEEKEEISKKKGNLLLQRIQKNYSLEENRAFEKPTGSDDLRIVILGKTGVGKSATANTILGKDVFKEDVTTVSVTQNSACHTNTINGRKVSVIDTPGLQDCDRPEEEILREVARVVKMFREGIHSFVYVLNLATPRFTEEDKQSMAKIEMMFGGKMRTHRLLIYTHAESHLNNTLGLDEFLKTQLSYGTVAAGYLREYNGDIVAVNNKGVIDGERERNQNVILGMVDKIKRKNNDAVYTNENFTNAMAIWDKYKDDLLKSGSNITIINTIEKVIDEYPETATEFQLLKKKVKEKIDEELKQLEDIQFNISMKEMQEDASLLLETVESENRKRGWKNHVKDVTRQIMENKELVHRDDFDTQIREIAQSHQGVFQRIFNFMKSTWKSLFQ